MNTSNDPCSGATLGLLFRQLRDAMWARMKLELANLGHDLTFSQYITLKKLALPGSPTWHARPRSIRVR